MLRPLSRRWPKCGSDRIAPVKVLGAGTNHPREWLRCDACGRLWSAPKKTAALTPAPVSLSVQPLRLASMEAQHLIVKPARGLGNTRWLFARSPDRQLVRIRMHGACRLTSNAVERFADDAGGVFGAIAYDPVHSRLISFHTQKKAQIHASPAESPSSRVDSRSKAGTGVSDDCGLRLSLIAMLLLLCRR
jgi:hypothetical protein